MTILPPVIDYYGLVKFRWGEIFYHVENRGRMKKEEKVMRTFPKRFFFLFSFPLASLATMAPLDQEDTLNQLGTEDFLEKINDMESRGLMEKQIILDFLGHLGTWELLVKTGIPEARSHWTQENSRLIWAQD